MTFEKLTNYAAPRAAGMARATRRVLTDPREMGKPWGNYEAEPGRLTRLFTLHDASLSGHMHAAVHNVKVAESAGGRWQEFSSLRNSVDLTLMTYDRSLRWYEALERRISKRVDVATFV